VYDVLDHYSKKMEPGPTTDSLLKHKLPLSNFEKGQLVAFLMTLTDTAFVRDPRFAESSKNDLRFTPAAHHLR